MTSEPFNERIAEMTYDPHNFRIACLCRSGSIYVFDVNENGLFLVSYLFLVRSNSFIGSLTMLERGAARPREGRSIQFFDKGRALLVGYLKKELFVVFFAIHFQA